MYSGITDYLCCFSFTNANGGFNKLCIPSTFTELCGGGGGVEKSIELCRKEHNSKKLGLMYCTSVFQLQNRPIIKFVYCTEVW